jgi:predicted HicB family RNase H-like nuclease
MAGKTEYKNQWAAENYQRISLTVKKGAKDALQQQATDKGESLNGYIKQAIKERYYRETHKDIDV